MQSPRVPAEHLERVGWECELRTARQRLGVKGAVRQGSVLIPFPMSTPENAPRPLMATTE